MIYRGHYKFPYISLYLESPHPSPQAWATCAYYNYYQYPFVPANKFFTFHYPDSPLPQGFYKLYCTCNTLLYITQNIHQKWQKFSVQSPNSKSFKVSYRNSSTFPKTSKIKDFLNKDLRYKRKGPSYFRHHLITILIKSCSARGRLDPFPKEMQNKTIKPNKIHVKPFVPWYILN